MIEARLSPRRWLPFGLVGLACAGALLACSVGGPGGTSGSASATSTAATGCATLPGFAHATTPPSGGAHFTDTDYPPGATGYSSDQPEANGFQYRLLTICAPGAAAASVRPFYATDLGGRGWQTTPTFPSAGDLSAACPAATDCYIKNDGVIRFLAVSEAASSSGLTTYTLRLVIQPYAFGSAALTTSDTLDFDPTLGGGSDDITWTGSQITPVGSAKLAGVGLEGSLNTLSYAAVAALPFTAAPIPASALAPGYVFAALTADGRYAKARVLSQSGGQLQIEYVTYPYTF